MNSPRHPLPGLGVAAAPSGAEPAGTSVPAPDTAQRQTVATPADSAPAAPPSPIAALAPLAALAAGAGRAPAEDPAAALATRPAAKRAAGVWSWVPIRSLGARHRERILAHLLALDERARYLRFGFAATDAQIAQYVDRIDFDRDEVFGIFNRRLSLIAMAHLAHPSAPATPGRPVMSEFGVSVLARARRRGFGARLFEHAALHARNRGVRAMFIHALSENAPMIKIARDAGATVHRDGSETEAWVELPPDTFASHLDEIVGSHAAELDYRLKAAQQVILHPVESEPRSDGSRDAETPSGVE